MVGTYEADQSLPTYNDVCAVLRGTLAELGMSLAAEGFDVLARWLTHPFNDALYRQQAFARFAAARQDDPAPAGPAFRAFLARHRPRDLAGPTQKPGVIRTPSAEIAP